MKKCLQVALGVMLGMGLLLGDAAAMNKAELVEAMASNSGLSKADAKKALDGFVSATTKALKKGDRISMVGFGSFSISKRSARTGRNPQTGKEIKQTEDRCGWLHGVDFVAAAPFIHSEETELEEPPSEKECPDFRILDDIDMIQAITRDTGLRDRQVVAAYNTLLDIVIATINSGGEVCIEGFGDFYVGTDATVLVPGFDTIDNAPEEKERGRARSGRNPQTGKEIKIAARGLDENALKRLVKMATQVAATDYNSSRSNKPSSSFHPGNPDHEDSDSDGDGLGDCDDGVCVTTKKTVKFKAGAELSKSVN